ncbi:hypothetical protein CJD36_002295 [Flavipsychrobacter stenotrophus]|uniref:SGNH hydrolase-type esterase domain-containing protein n=2 Tax=Flavipsychrobacter stenotrophus TaxID=2077091 RepID=A0A2S7T164_9BACT|nr:hypothetical protein CJD36_002295 [Flavipsychrobacter stenotrophus]
MPKKLQKNVLYLKNSTGHLSTRLAEADTCSQVDVLALGSSHTYRGFDPRIFRRHGISLFNLGSSAQSPIQTEYLVKKYIDKIHPRVVVFDMYYTILQCDGTESALDLFSNSPGIDKGLFEMALKVNTIPAYNTFVYSWFKTLNRQNIKEPAIKNNDTYIPGGFVERTINNNQYHGQHIAPAHFEINELQLKSLQNIVKILKEKNIRLILVQTPYAPDSYRSVVNRDSLDRYLSSLKDAEYYNFNDTNIFKNDYFFDFSHLNSKGVEVYDSILINKLFPGGHL